MTVDKLKRIMQRLRFDMRRNTPNDPDRNWCRRKEMERAVFIVCGTTRMTYWNNVRALRALGWVTKYKRSFKLTGKDLTEDF
jgi:hypothetical protein